MWRLIIGSVLALLVALSLVGAGVDGAFTSAVTVEGRISAGTFSLSAVVLGQGSVAEMGDLPAAGATPVSGASGSGALSFSIGNAQPGQIYYYEFAVYDAGSVPGVISSLAYIPASGSVLDPSSSVSVTYDVNGQWVGVGGASLPADTPETFGVNGSLPLIPRGVSGSVAGSSEITFALLVRVANAASNLQVQVGGSVLQSRPCDQGSDQVGQSTVTSSQPSDAGQDTTLGCRVQPVGESPSGQSGQGSGGPSDAPTSTQVQAVTSVISGILTVTGSSA